MQFEELTLDILLNLCLAQSYKEEVDCSKCLDVMNAFKASEYQNNLQNLPILTNSLHVYVIYLYTYISI